MEACCSRFTAAEGGARLAAVARVNNTLAVEYSMFIATRLVYEDAYKIRGSLFNGSKRSIYVTRATRVDVVAYELNILTDLSVIKAKEYGDVFDWYADLEKKEVVVCTSTVLKQILEENIITMMNINVLVLDSCHLISKDEALKYIMKLYKDCDENSRPRILALTYPLFASTKKDNHEPIADDSTRKRQKQTATAENERLTSDSDEKSPVLSELEDVIPKISEIEDVAEDKELNNDDKTNEALVEIEESQSIEASERTDVVHRREENLIADMNSCTMQNMSDVLQEVNGVEPRVLVEEEVNEDIDTNKGEEIGVYENLDDFEMYEKLEWKIQELEKELCCQMDLAEDVDGGKRLSSTIAKPKELLIEYNVRRSQEMLSPDYLELETYMRETVQEAVDFIYEHRYDPTEIYGEDMYEDFKNIPDPTIDPKHIFKQFLYILDQLGPYGADKAAFSLLTKLEKLKIKVPYERHFLLLCLCTSVLIKIRCFADIMFSKYESDWERIQLFSTPKVLRFAEILEKFQPPEQNINDNNAISNVNDDKDAETKATVVNDEKDSKETQPKIQQKNTSQLLKELDNCDFISLGNKIEDKINTFEANLKEIVDLNLENVKSSNNNSGVSELNKPNDTVDGNEANNTRKGLETNSDGNELNNARNDNNNARNDNNNAIDSNQAQKGVLGFARRTGHRARGRGRVLRNNAVRVQQMQQNPDALCGIVFMKEAFMAKIMFMVIVDMSRSNSKLSYLCAQFCAVEQPANPGTEPKECQRQGKKQEDVLKKFRMHECNLLLTTSALEEGIDLPRCNLVLRWDVPASYRSYGLCRSRARAPRAACAVLSCGVGSQTDTLLHNVAVYRELDQIISRKCGCGIQDEPPQIEEDHADSFTPFVKPYMPVETKKLVDKSVSQRTRNDHDESESSNKIIIIENKSNSSRNEFNNDANILNSRDEIVIETKIITDEETKPIIEDNKSKVVLDNNLICNKCNNKRNSVDVVCPCVNISENLINNCGNKNNNAGDKRSDSDSASVDLSTAIALINRYCGKLPSDTFTRLAPQWWMEEVQLPVKNAEETRKAFICTLRLPLNCPVKYNIVGHPMPTRVLARRMVALQACRILHKSGELDNQLMPIGKENFKAVELETTNITSTSDSSDPSDTARPGTTKRRQYYYKRTAWAFTDCQPVVDATDAEIDPPRDGDSPRTDVQTEVKEVKKGTKRNMLYAIVSKLWCALPERYNTRGRRLHAPQNASQAIGILMARDEPDSLQIPAFPVYTRSGEVRVSVEHVPDADVRMSPRRGRLVRRFMRFVFAEVLRVRRRGMRLQSEGSTHNNYYIVPTIKTIRPDGTSKIDIDWSFLELIYQHTEEKRHSAVEKTLLWQQDEEEDDVTQENVEEQQETEKDGKVKKMENPLLKAGETFCFDAEKYREAVVTPWYRNQDQPQFFLVAEICSNLTPDSAFPSATHTSFRNYYSSKYGVTLTQSNQPLLDVDHTSARLNLLTPRYVNRKGVALPVSSERTRRAKRDRLDQKQILVPELCRVHPFAAPLWFATVALPCVLYRINALLIADEIRRAVAIDVGLGIPKIDETTRPAFQWPPLDFGWSLAEVLSADSEKNEKKKEEDDASSKEEKEAREKEELESQEETSKDKEKGEAKEKTLNDILQEKEIEAGFEIGMWSNDMASSIPQTTDYDEYMEPLPPNLTFCTSASGGTNWCDPIEKPKSHFQQPRTYSMADSDCSYMSSDFDTDDSDVTTDGDDDTDLSGFCSSKNSNGTNYNAAMGVRIEYKTAHEAEAIDLERSKKTNPAPQPDDADDAADRRVYDDFIRSGEAPDEHIEKFRQAVSKHQKEIVDKGYLINKDKPIVDILPETTKESHDKLTLNHAGTVESHGKLERNDSVSTGDFFGNNIENNSEVSNEESSNKLNKNTDGLPVKYIGKDTIKTHTKLALNDEELEEISTRIEKLNIKNAKIIDEIFPYGNEEIVIMSNGQIDLESIEKNKRKLLAELKRSLPEDDVKKLNCFSMVDVDIDSPKYVNEKVVNVGFDSKEVYVDRMNKWIDTKEFKPYFQDSKAQGKEFDFDYQPDLEGHPGPSPSVILQALTMSNANDGINLERLETIGDSFLKFAITAYLYCAHPTVHEGKLSHMRSKQVSNLNLYRLGRNKRLGARMIASKFEPHDNWLPPCHKPPSTLHPRMGESDPAPNSEVPLDNAGCFIPYNLITQHSIPDKSIADCVEALIGAYLLECGPRGALLFMSWLGIRVLPRHDLPLPPNHPYVAGDHLCVKEKPEPLPSPKRQPRDSDTDDSSDDDDQPNHHQQDPQPEDNWSWSGRPVGSLRPYINDQGVFMQPIFGELKAPPSPLLRYIEDPEGELEQMLSGYDALERTLQYRFKDRSLLLQALTHASHQQNRLTDCYQRLEFLGDAILDYLITRHLYEDPRRHSPGALTDLRSALVNNTIFATLAARHGFHKYFRHMSPGLNEVLTKYVKIQEENGHSISEEHYLIQEDEMEQAEDVEVPKALGDLFESVAGAIFLDSGMSLGAVWKSYVNLMGAELEAFSAAAPKSPVRELLEAEPDTAKFGKPERLADGRRVRVCVEVFGRGAFKGVGRNYRIAKGTAARCALRHLRAHRR